MQSYTRPEENLVGSWRRFGAVGPIYEVLGKAQADAQEMHIRVLDTGEELDYPISDILDDPPER